MIKKLFKYSITAVIVIFCLTSLAYYRAVDLPIDKKASNLMFTVTLGDSAKTIGKNLFSQGLIKSESFFNFYLWQSKKAKNIKAGTYNLSARLTMKEIISVLSSGETGYAEKEITIIPGWDLNDISSYLEAQGVSSADDFLKITGQPLKNYQNDKKDFWPKDYSDQYDFLADKPKNYGLEGYLFPDTYRVYKTAKAEDIISKALNDFDKKLTPVMRADIKGQGKTIYQIVTMASVVEKEVRTEKDMKVVSGIFWDRIKNGQPLQSCATLAYIIGKDKTVYSLADTKIKSPFNTYQFQGLPPGPICNPSLQALEAAIYPVYTDYNYFLSRPDTGETIFSKTFEEHNRNKLKYLK